MVSDTLWVHRHLCFIHSYAKRILALPWIGQKKWKAKNWMAIAREYTEKWLHQQQIRDAIQQP